MGKFQPKNHHQQQQQQQQQQQHQKQALVKTCVFISSFTFAVAPVASAGTLLVHLPVVHLGKVVTIKKLFLWELDFFLAKN